MPFLGIILNHFSKNPFITLLLASGVPFDCYMLLTLGPIIVKEPNLF